MPKYKKQQKIVDQNQQQQEEQEQSSEDEDGALLTDKVQQTLLETLAKIKLKDPSIYQTTTSLYKEQDFVNGHQHKNKNKSTKLKLTYKDLLAEGQDQDQEDESQQNLPPVEEQKNAKEKFKRVLQKNIQQIQRDGQDLFKVKDKITKKQQQKQNSDEKQKFNELTKNFDKSSKKLIKRVWNSEELDQTDLFLKDYILDKKWLTSKIQQENNPEQQQIDEEDEERSLQMDQYQAQYNFRFEEPGGTTITQYPRAVQNSLRQKPQTRKEKRKKHQQKKRQEQQALRKQAQIKRQELKKSILQRLQPQNEEEEEDHDWFFCDDCCRGLHQGETIWQCSECQDYMLCQQCNQLIIHKHKLQKGLVSEGFGAPQNCETSLQNLKSCIICRKRITPTKKRYQYTDRSYIVTSMCENCYDQSNLSTKKKYKQVEPQTINYEQMLQKNPQKIKQLTNHKEIQEMIDEYLKNQFEDVLSGGLKTKFRYMSVPAQSFGLSDQQILFGDDKELNKYVSIKNLAPYKQEKVRLRSSIFNQKIKSIKRSVKKTKNLLQKGQARIARMRYINKRQNRVLAVRKRLQKKLRITNLSNKETERNYFVPNSRLESYGIKTMEEQA